MTKKQFYILLSALFVALLIFSNPSEENHIESVKSKVKIAFKKKMTSKIIENEEKSVSALGNGLGLLLGDTFIDKLTDGIVSRNNYLLFSLTKAEYKGEEKIIGFGILGNVFISDKIDNIFKDKEEIAQEEFKEKIPDSNQNNDRFEFTSDMLLNNEILEDEDYKKSLNEDILLSGVIVQILDNFEGIKVKITKSMVDEFGETYNIGDIHVVYFNSVKYNGKSNMCKKCETDFKELIEVGRKIKFKMRESIGGGSYGEGIWSLTYVNVDEN